MLVRLDLRAAEALHRAKHDRDLMKFLSDELDETLKLMVTQKDDVVFRQLQGKAQFLMDLREQTEKSADLAAKLGAQKTGR